MLSGKTRVCPVCDSKIEEGLRQCPECNTDLSLFDVDSDGVPDVDKTPVPGGKAIDDILASIVKDKEVRPDIFDRMKTIATDGTQEEDILADTPGELGVEFACPECGARVAANAQRCPSCGAEFAEETVEQFECPLCNAVVDVDATSCPSCGVQFAQEEPTPPAKPEVAPPAPPVPPIMTGKELARAEQPAPAPKEPLGSSSMERLWRLTESRRIPPGPIPADRAALYKELPRLVNDVKPLLLVAKKVGVEIAPEKELISDAIAHGKKRNVERAVQLIREAQFRLEETYTAALAKRIESVLAEAERSRQTGGEVGQVVTLCTASIEALERRDYADSSERIRDAKEEFDARSGGYAKARQEYELSKTLVIDAKKLGLDLREANTDLRRSESALQARNWDQAALLAVQARQSLFKALPGLLVAEMKKARNTLLEMKVKGGDLAKPVGILKQASIHMKREEFADALKFVAMFRDQVGSL